MPAISEDALALFPLEWRDSIRNHFASASPTLYLSGSGPDNRYFVVQYDRLETHIAGADDPVTSIETLKCAKSFEEALMVVVNDFPSLLHATGEFNYAFGSRSIKSDLPSDHWITHDGNWASSWPKRITGPILKYRGQVDWIWNKCSRTRKKYINNATSKNGIFGARAEAGRVIYVFVCA